MARCVLVVDDEPSVVLSLEFLIQQVGYEVRVALDGDAALASIAERVPDLVLLDVMMPRRGGYDVCRAIRANPAWAEMRVIMLTGRGRDSDRAMGQMVGADESIAKPFVTREVVEKISRFLGTPYEF
jgi:DNA-binding response OmpR family regulator